MKKIIAIEINNESEKELEMIQLELFQNGFEWETSGKKIHNYINGNWIVIIDGLIYSMESDGIRYLSKNEDIKMVKIHSVTDYFRLLKLKKIRQHEKFIK